MNSKWRRAARCLLVLTTVFALSKALQVHAATPELTYRLHCEGCHKPDGSGQPGFIPSFDLIGDFSSLPKGREFLIRVPGVSQSELDEVEIVSLMNWLVPTYGGAEHSVAFQPFTVSEVKEWRVRPLSDASAHRSRLIALLGARSDGATSVNTMTVTSSVEDNKAAKIEEISPPPAFALCGACHATSKSGAHGMGPNLRGVVDRLAGGATGFAYTKAMREAGFKWDADRLDAFLRSPSSVVPNTSMIYAGEPDVSKRSAVIKYLESLR